MYLITEPYSSTTSQNFSRQFVSFYSLFLYFFVLLSVVLSAISLARTHSQEHNGIHEAVIKTLNLKRHWKSELLNSYAIFSKLMTRSRKPSFNLSGGTSRTYLYSLKVATKLPEYKQQKVLKYLKRSHKMKRQNFHYVIKTTFKQIFMYLWLRGNCSLRVGLA
uniref:Uncharacterized protein n=1 Tax=Glossina pallidipes TaxID=7398 RepID=A0A1B0AJL6_GLOPL